MENNETNLQSASLRQLLNEVNQRVSKHMVALEEASRLNEELKLLNQRLEDSEKLKSHFLSNIRNQIINPFASILGLSENITRVKERPENWKRAKHMARLIFDEAFNLDFQLSNIFAAAKLEAGDTHPEIVRVNLLELTKSTIQAFRHKCLQKEMTLELRLDLDQPEAKAFTTDPIKLKVILANLISNAVNFSNASNTIDIEASLRDGCFIFSVRDRGIGIAPEDLKVIFDRFKRLNPDINSIHQGHGLGLSVAKAMLDILDGRIEIESRRGHGSFFCISIPQNHRLAEPKGFEQSDDGEEFLFDDFEKF